MQLPLNVSPVSASFIGLQRRGILLVLSTACASHVFAVHMALACLRTLSSASTSSFFHSLFLYSFVLFLLSAKLK
jgi:hypothetical protein